MPPLQGEPYRGWPIEDAILNPIPRRRDHGLHDIARRGGLSGVAPIQCRPLGL